MIHGHEIWLMTREELLDDGRREVDTWRHTVLLGHDRHLPLAEQKRRPNDFGTKKELGDKVMFWVKL